MGATTFQKTGVDNDEKKSWRTLERESLSENEDLILWEQGKAAGKQEVLKEIGAYFSKGIKRLRKAQDVCESMWNYLESKEIHPVGLFLKADEMVSFTGLFVIEKSQIRDLEAKGVYDENHNLTDPLTRKDFDLEISFVSHSPSFDIRKVMNEGFAFTYGKTKI